jgi:hypothetical protein
MKRMLFNLAALAVLGGVASAQNPVLRRGPEKEPDPAAQIAWSRTPPTEAMWMYEQQKRDYLDTRLAIRRRAEYTAWQRRSRLASLAWYGYSNSRPSWSPTPFMSGTFSPSWTGNDYLDRYRWYTAPPPVVVRSESDSLHK